jgi:hypothetical protein
MSMIRFHQRSHPIVLSKESYAAAALAARLAMPVLIKKGRYDHAALLSKRIAEFVERSE